MYIEKNARCLWRISPVCYALQIWLVKHWWETSNSLVFCWKIVVLLGFSHCVEGEFTVYHQCFAKVSKTFGKIFTVYFAHRRCKLPANRLFPQTFAHSRFKATSLQVVFSDFRPLQINTTINFWNIWTMELGVKAQNSTKCLLSRMLTLVCCSVVNSRGLHTPLPCPRVPTS